MRLLHTSRPRSMFVHVHSRDGAERKKEDELIWFENSQTSSTVMLSTQHQAAQWLFCCKVNESSARRVQMSLTKNICSPREKVQETQAAHIYHASTDEVHVLREQKEHVNNTGGCGCQHSCCDLCCSVLLQAFLLIPFTSEIQKKHYVGKKLRLGSRIISVSRTVSLRQHWNLFDGSGAVDVSCCVELSRFDLGPECREILYQQGDGTPHSHWLRSTGLPEDPLEAQQWLIHWGSKMLSEPTHFHTHGRVSVRISQCLIHHKAARATARLLPIKAVAGFHLYRDD